ncbi:MAG: methyltransferase domain-containing protein [Candidatus Hydrothermarchaeales archaeon]
MEVGRSKGRKRSIHLPVKLILEADGGASLLGLIGDKKLGRIEFSESLKGGTAWLIIVPYSGTGQSTRLDDLSADGAELNAKFTGSPFGSLDVSLDNRGRAHNLEVGKMYSINILQRKKFFEMYEQRSIPAGKGGRSEPGGIGNARLKNFEEMASSTDGKVLDVATGIKEYLQTISEKRSLTCGNISPSMLRRTMDWLGNGTFVAYDVESGLPFKDNCFDLIICDALLEYVDDPNLVLRDVARMVGKGGDLLLLEPIKPLSEIGDFYPQDLWEVAIWRPIYEDTFNGTALEETLRKEGFRERERRSMNFDYTIYDEERFQQDVVRFAKL